MNPAPESDGDATDGIPAAVRNFYERHPYPPPVASLERERERWNDGDRRRTGFRLLWPDEPFREDHSILVAGCGTSQAAKYALRWPNARVVGIDVSRTGIAQTRKLKERYGLANLDLEAIAVEQVRSLGRRFDHIVCTGVLHHLEDPDAGLRALRDTLAPRGALHVMVYAPYGRAGIYLLQEYCRRLHVGTSSRDIRDVAATLGALPPRHPLAPLLRETPDFATEAGLADALLHPRDRPYCVPELFAFLERGGLQFGRWLRQAPYLPGCGAMARTPHRARLANLPAEAQYAAMELFRGTMLRHSAIAYRDDTPSAERPIRFDDDAWRAYVPFRLPDTVCVEERLPPGAAGVLINRSHHDTDIYLPIDACRRSWYERIDGRRRIVDIVEDEGQMSDARDFFERLWQHDQIVLDATPTGRAATRPPSRAPCLRR